jgi:hypothetical protein
VVPDIGRHRETVTLRTQIVEVTRIGAAWPDDIAVGETRKMTQP